MKLYVIHATCRRMTRNVHTKETESGTYRPTIAVEASSESDALAKAKKKEEAKYKSDTHNELLSFSLVAELVNVKPAAKVTP